MSVDLVNVSPRGALALHVDDEAHTVDVGETLTCTPEAAGRAPSWQPASPAEVGLYSTGLLLVHTRIVGGRLEVFDLGSGLLAQTENWQPAGDTTEPADPLDQGDGTELSSDAGMENG
jgi:hypothetical protein